MSDLVGNPEDWFYRVAALILYAILSRFVNSCKEFDTQVYIELTQPNITATLHRSDSS